MTAKGGANVPDGWQRVRLGDVLKLEYGVSLPDRKRVPGDIPVIGSAGVVDYHNRATNDGPGIVIGRKGSIGSVTWVAENFVPIDTTYFAVPIDGEVNLRWAYHFLSREDLSKLNRATGIPGLNRDDVYSLQRFLPPLPEQRAIAAVLDSIDNVIAGAEAVIAATGQLRDSLLHDLLTHGLPGQHTEFRDVPGLGAIPADWEVVRLGDVATVRNGTTPSRKNLQFWGTEGIPFVKTGQVNDVYISHPEEFITHEAIENAGPVIVPEGSVLIAMIGQGKTRGMIAKLGFRAAINQNFAAVYEPKVGFALDYFFAWGNQNYPLIRALGQGSNQDALNCNVIQGMKFPLPPPPEQLAIAAALDGVDAAVDVARGELAGLRLLKESTADTLLTGQVRMMGGGPID